MATLSAGLLLTTKRHLNLTACMVLLLSLIGSGCTSLSSPTPSFAEPSVIAVRNSTGRDIQKVSFSGIPTQRVRTVRFGSVSPLPRDVTQSITRPSRAPRLPAKGRITWLDHQGRTFTKEVAITDVTKSPDNPVGEVLVFDIFDKQQVRVLRESP